MSTTAVTIDDIKASQAKTAALIAAYEAQAAAQRVLLRVPEADILLAPGEVYAGAILNDDGTLSHHLVLLPPHPGEDKRKNWESAKAWAASIGGELPTRREQSLLFANAKQHFDAAYYWSSEAYEDDGAYAWLQIFRSGGQGFNLTSYEARVRAVRRIPIGG